MKTALVTGGSRGIGAACVRLLRQKGYDVVFLYEKNEQRAAEVECQTGAKGYRCDVSVKSQVKAAVDEILATYRKIDLLINNAAVSNGQKLFCDITEIQWQRLLSVNVTGIFNTIQCVLPSMLSRHDGRIINVSSVWGLQGASCEVDYSASKGAVIALTKALAQEVAPSGILVNCVAPGVVDTDMNAHLSDADKQALCDEIPMGRMATADEIAQCIFSVAEMPYLTGQIISPNGGQVV